MLSHSPSQLPAPPAAAAANPAGVADILSILRNAGMQNPLADLQATLGAAAAPAAAAARGVSASQSAAVGTVVDDHPGVVKGQGDGAGSGSADVADAGPTLAGDDIARGAPDVSNNLLALLSQLAPAGQ